ncbi:MAG: ATP-dependent RecD-like DNA helicase [Clostridia bacterium]|nr:ATP-dependent RecD-like DNA helicase [Clostridia bacterium]
MTFDGKVEEIVYVNEESGYTVLNFSADDNYFTAVGIFPLIAEGELLRISGEFKTNARFGEQFVVDRVEFYKPDTVEGIYKFLAGGLFRGVGEKTAMLIVNYFGLDTLKVLDEHPERLCEVKGIGTKKCLDIIRGYNESRKMKESILFLQKYDITMGLAVKIYKKYEDVTINVVRDNPYRLVEDIDGVGFITADKIASKMGIDKHSPFRVRAGLLHVLTEASHSGGHTCLPVEELIASAVKLLGVTEEECRENLPLMNLKTLTVDGVEVAAAAVNYETENAIAAKLLRLIDNPSPADENLDNDLFIYEKVNKITLDEKQKEAIKSVFHNGVTVITGGPGTGKTTIIKGVVALMRLRRKKVTLAAPTGRACKRITEATGEEARTLHRLLGIDFSSDRRSYDEINPLPVDVLIVDEISMADIYIFNALLKAVPTGARLVLVGDKDQLPSVSCGNILSDTIESGLVNTVFLTEVHRQAEGSYIVTNAHRINNGQMPVYKGAKDFFFISRSEEDAVQEVVGMVKTRIPAYLGVTPSDVQVLAPMKKSVVGVENLNAVLQDALNPRGTEKELGQSRFRVGDRVMQTSNNYQLEWKRDDGEHGTGIFNGDLGKVVAFDKEGMTVLFEDGKRVVYAGSDADEIMLAYAVSVHKSQGSEFPVVILVLGSGGYTLLTRNLLYTAVTRARKMVVVIGSEATVKRMVANTYTVKRYSLLKHLLLKNKKKYDLLWGGNG